MKRPERVAVFENISASVWIVGIVRWPIETGHLRDIS